ncbi:MAG: T9SS type A sorting domain-containing protein [Bacteroidetes bacterium]|nr:T9SS type A sorting domain-containing protein [Bacteroidota bacterium]
MGPGGSQTFNYTGSVQNFTVPVGITSINIDARGAQGGTFGNAIGGLGAKMVGDVSVLPGQVLSVWVGQQGVPSQNAGGGGGGSGVTNGATPLVIAGGGGGGCSVNMESGKPGLITTSGGNSSGAGGVAGDGGQKGYVPGDCGWAGGGGGFLGDGNGGPSGGDGGPLPGTLGGPAAGKSAANGGAGGIGGSCGFSLLGAGGWGCGGGGRAEYGGGGGGGYSGGGGGQYVAVVGSKGGGGGGSINSGINQVNTSGVQSGNGQVIITWGGAAPCFSVRVPVTVTVNAAPTVTATASADSICVGGSSVLTGGGAVSYVWNPGGLVGSPTVTPAVTTTYTVTGTNAAGCTATATVMVTVNNTPVVTATASPSIICAGASSVLTGGGAATYTWNPGGLVGSPTVTPATTTIYTVTGSVGVGCSATSIVIVTVNPAPPVTASASPASICVGGSTVLTGGGAATYLWNPGGLAGSPTVSPLVTTTYTVTGSVAGGCTATSVVTVTVNPGINVTATAAPSTICVGASSVLTGSGGVVYTWLPGGLGGSPTVTPVVTTTYTVTGSNGAGCTGTSVVTVTVVSLNPIIVNTVGVLSVLNGPYTTYQWYRNGTPIAGATNPTHTVVQNGTYEVEVTLNGCTKRSPSLILNGVGVNDITLNGYSISPNPTKDKITVNGLLPAEIKILNMQGQIVKQAKNTSEISLSNLSNGSYFIQLFNEKGLRILNQKITKY